jgi:predicted Ser/Thr protein kinase
MEAEQTVSRLLLIGLCCLLGPLLMGVFTLGVYLASRRPDRAAKRASDERPRRRVTEPSPPAVASHCPECGVELPADAPEGLCPQCLLKGVISSAHDAARSAPAQATTPYGGPAAPSVEELAPLFPQLELLELIGQGGMGAVYKARQPSLDRLVAVKVLPPEAGKDPAFAERFNREARALARLSHPNIVAVHDVGKAGEFYYFVMEYVDGVNLRQVLRDGRLTPEQALRIVPQICDALQYAHEEGVVHRDIKPENILLDRKGRVKIADFGLAKLLGRDTGHFTLTGSRQVMGTLYYMAPEQVERPLEVDHRADIYSLGVVFYEMLTGQLPVGRFPMPSEKAGTDTYLDEVVLHALEREPANRYQHASEVKTDVEAPARRATILAPGAEAGDTELARHQLNGPANGLMVMGLLGPLGWLVVLLVYMVYLYANSSGGAGSESWLYGLDNGFGYLVLLFFVSAVVGGFLLAGGRKMKRLEAYEFSVLSSLMTVLQLPALTAPISLIIGGWAFWVLRKPEVKAAFAAQLRQIRRRPRFEEPQPAGQVVRAAQARVRGSALGLLLVGVLHTATLPVAALLGWFPLMGSGTQQLPGRGALHGPFASAGLPDVATSLFADVGEEPTSWYRMASVPLLLLSVSLGAFIIGGALQMLRLRSHGLAMAAAILALLPCGPAWPIGLPVGIWALAVLAAPEVKAAFCRRG